MKKEFSFWYGSHQHILGSKVKFVYFRSLNNLKFIFHCV